MAFLENQNQTYDAENQALRQAQIVMDERHTAEIIELKHSQLSAVKGTGLQDDDEDHQMLINLVKVKDEEIMQLKRQIGNGSEYLDDSAIRSNASPLRPSKQGSAGRHDGLRPIDLDNSRLEDQLSAMNQETLEEQVKALIKDNYDLKMQCAADADQIENLSRDIGQLRQPYKLQAQQDELRDVKCQVYEVINTCQHMLISQSMDYDQNLEQE